MRPSSLIGLVALLALGVGSPLAAENAIYSVALVNSEPAGLLVKIDTHPWPEDQQARTANVTVVLKRADGSQYTKTRSFLEGVSSPKFLAADQVYQRTLRLDADKPVSIVSSRVTFPNDTGKTDERNLPPAPVGTAGAVGATTVAIGGNVVVPPPTAKMSYEPRSNRNGMDLAQAAVAVGSAQQCSDLCLNERQCHAFTFVKAAGAGGDCWLKGGVPARESCENCTSGVKTP